MTKKFAPRHSLMKSIGWAYIALAALLAVVGLWLAVSLFRADFYADYRRGAHMVAGSLALGFFWLLALGMFVQGSMANAVADIDRNTRVNSDAIEETRKVSEVAVRAGQNALKNSEAMIHAQSALSAARASQPALPPVAAAPVAAAAVLAEQTEEPTDVFGAAPETAAMLQPRVIASPLERSAPPAAPDMLTPPGARESLVDGVIGIGGKLKSLVSQAPTVVEVAPSAEPAHSEAANEPEATEKQFELDAPRQPAPPATESLLEVPEVAGAPIDSTDAVVQNLFARAKGAVVRSRRPWARE